MTTTIPTATITGSSLLDDTLTGTAGNDVIDGLAGADTMIGGLGDDVYIVDDFGDVVTEVDTGGTGTDTVYSYITYSLGDFVENLVLIDDAGAINGTGNSLNNVLTGNNANNDLTGLLGDDTYFIGAGDRVFEALNGGTDTVNSSVTYTLAANVEKLNLATGLTAALGKIDGIGNILDNTLTGNEYDNLLDGKTGVDSMIGGGGNDTYVVDNTGDTVTGNTGVDTVTSSVTYDLSASTTAVENLTLTGTVAINGTGNDLNNTITDTTTSTLINTLTGGNGNDTYFINNTGDIVTEGSGTGSGTDTVNSSATYTLLTNIENLTLTGTSAINGTGNAADNILTGNVSTNILTGGDGNDTYYVTAGDTISEVDAVTSANAGTADKAFSSATTYTLGANVEQLELQTGAVSGTGNSSANIITGNSGANTLDGKTGVDTLIGGLGNDIYYVDETLDVVQEASAAGIDTVNSSASSYTLADFIENLTLVTGSAAVTGTGNGLANTLVGNAAANTLDGKAGADSMTGGLGSDTYMVDNTLDVVTEAADATLNNADIVNSTVDYTLAANIENLTLVAASSALKGTGNSLANTLTGNSNANTLDGSVGADTMDGIEGADTYIVDNTLDKAIDTGTTGADLVKASATFTLDASIENLTLTGTSTINGTGNGSVNTLTGNAAANILDGKAGADIMIGGGGADTYMVDDAGDKVDASIGTGVDTVKSSVSYDLSSATLITGNVENLTLLDTALNTGANINASGNALNNTLTGNSGNNVIDGGAGTDIMIGGAGNDTYTIDVATDVISEALNGGTDTVNSPLATYTLTTNVENLTLTGTAITGIGNALDNTLTGNASANSLNGSTGNDTMAGNAGDDTYYVDSTGDSVTDTAGTDTVISTATFTLASGNGVETLILTGTGVIDGTGNELANTLTGNTAANVLTGGNGGDTYNVGTGDSIVELATDTGTDIVNSAVTYALSSNVETLNLTGSAAINGTGSAEANTLNGNAAANILDGGAGADTMVGGGGADTYIVDNAGDTVTGGAGIDTVQSSVTYSLATSTSNVENLTLTGTSAINGTGDDANDTLIGNAAANTLNGGLGSDTMSGGAGNDTYVVNVATDTVSELGASTDIDTVQSAISYTLGTNLENLVLTSTNADNGTGNALDNTLTGNDAANTLNGGAGIDRLIGNAGNDIYYVDQTADVVTEAANADIDTVNSTATYTLSANVENLNLIGTLAINGTGNGLANTLVGNDMANTLNGGLLGDTMTGGKGGDTYIVDSNADVVIESSTIATEIDKVISGVTYSLSNALGGNILGNIENLTLTGTATNATGNGLANVLIGNAAANTLNGLVGADKMYGGDGNDIYFVDNTGDLVSETATLGAGIDTVKSAIDYTLGANVENLTLLDGTAVNGTGNGLNNLLQGNSTHNVLNGGVGADTMKGFAGDDTYYVDNVGDVVTDTTGNDTVNSLVSFTLTELSLVENLNLTGISTINGTGNSLDNTLTGNGSANTLSGLVGNDTISAGAGNDILNGGAGNDTLDGGLGKDALTGGAGADIFKITAIDTFDTLTDFSNTTTNGVDTIQLDHLVFTSLTAGALSSANFKSGINAATAVPVDANDFIIYNSTTGVLSYDADGNAGGAAVQIALIGVTTHAGLSAADFTVI